MSEPDTGENAARIAHSYKQLKEDFVSNLSGGSVIEVAQVCAVAPVVTLLWSVLQSRQSFFKPYTPLAFVIDYLLNVGALLLSVTLYSSSPILLNILLLTAAAFVYAVPPSTSSKKKQAKPNNAKATPSSSGLSALSTKPFLTNYRGNMMVVTCICILAVDFRLFPRRFAKVETWGTSLMDMGVGSFVYSAGIVASRPLLKERAEGKATPLSTRLIRSFRHSLPLLALGVVRLLSVKGLDYAEHVTEYGVHWNFFFTLGFLPPFVALFQSALAVVPSYAGLALLLSAGYQLILETTGLKAWILVGARDNLLSMNREGICSFWGYLAIFLAGQDMGMVVLPRSLGGSSPSSKTSARVLLTKMGTWAAVWLGLYFLATDFTYGAGLSVSRRLANLPYMLWVVAFNQALLFAFAVVDVVFFPQFYSAGAGGDARAEKEAYETATSRVLKAYNRNGLAVFLLANLLTGLVNMTVPTLHVGGLATMGILVAYMGAVTGVAVGLDVWNVTIKL
ncbi:GWT1-domain-containing protein [Apiosordaria backusii]|uniref:GPI-anchored wall transfer protein n=1 Tax=Apiosordaria backusii TaxID=314023 RepID=A0AA40EY89_9PEZI|nr:GWT1-domain-containing protein [Apiosordaria backusii]